MSTISTNLIGGFSVANDNNDKNESLMLGKESGSFDGVENSLTAVLANTIFMFSLYKKYH
jgi:hypothetical protein